MTPSTRARELDLLGGRLWPALEERELDGWRLRFSEGVTKRANSVLALAPGQISGAEIGRRISDVEKLYRERGLSPRFQLTASSQPAGLREILAKRGYLASDETLVMTAQIATIDALDSPAAVAASGRPSPEWFSCWWSVDGRGGEPEAAIARRILGSIAGTTRYAAVLEDGVAVAVGLGVIDADWLGIQCMATRPDRRRRGLARALLCHLTRWAAANDAQNGHLAVTSQNLGAQILYRSAGFVERQRYDYLTLPG